MPALTWLALAPARTVHPGLSTVCPHTLSSLSSALSLAQSIVSPSVLSQSSISFSVLSKSPVSPTALRVSQSSVSRGHQCASAPRHRRLGSGRSRLCQQATRHSVVSSSQSSLTARSPPDCPLFRTAPRSPLCLLHLVSSLPAAPSECCQWAAPWHPPLESRTRCGHFFSHLFSLPVSLRSSRSHSGVWSPP